MAFAPRRRLGLSGEHLESAPRRVALAEEDTASGTASSPQAAPSFLAGKSGVVTGRALTLFSFSSTR